MANKFNNDEVYASVLVMLTAITLMPAYGLQSVMASGHDATNLPWLFWLTEYSAWSLRAPIEAASLMYLFKTSATNNNQKYVLAFFKVAMICLISLTLAPVIFAKGLNQNTPQVLNVTAYWLWSFGVAAYAPLMIASVGVAYSYSRHNGAQSLSTAVLSKNNTDVLNAKLDAMAGIIDALQAKLDAKPKPQNEVDSKAARQAQIVAMMAQGVSGATELAHALGVSTMTVRRDMAELSKVHANGTNGNGKTMI